MLLLKKSPELFVLILITCVTYTFLLLDPQLQQIVNTQLSLSFSDLVILSFVISTAIAIIAVIAGVGGGVIFTPVMLAFTSVDTLIVRATGLIVAMFSGLVSTGPLMRQGLANIKLVFFGSLPIIVGGLFGAFSAIYFARYLGETGDAIVRLSLGLVLIGIAFLFIFSGSDNEYPNSDNFDQLGSRLKLRGVYYEESLQSLVRYKPTQIKLGFILFFVVGFTGGFFGLGGGWAVVPVLNLIMAVPLKVAAASSGVLLAMGNAAAIWPYINAGALIGVVAAPWMLGQVIGGIIGAHILVSIKAGFVRNLLICLLLLTSVKLVVRGLETLLQIDIPIF